MSKSKLSREPRKARSNGNAWWYENEGSIDVYIQISPSLPTGCCRITKRQIKSWLKKLEAK